MTREEKEIYIIAPIAKDYVDIYNGAETLLEKGYIDKTAYNRIINSLCRTVVGHFAMQLQKEEKAEE